MTSRVDLGDGKHVSISSHSGKVWVTNYNGCGSTNALDRKQALELAMLLTVAARKG